MDGFSEARLQNVHPVLASKIRTLAEMLLPEELIVVQGYRSWADQLKIWKLGRDEHDKVVGTTFTDAPPGHSWHCFGLACDVVAKRLMMLPRWAPDDPLWKEMISKGESLGMVSGACWHHPDQPHFQLTGRFPVSPTDEVRDLFKEGGVESVWEAALIG